MGDYLQMADLFFDLGELLEPGWRRLVRLPHQPAHCLVLHAGLNTTAVHGHTALFGVYGMLGIGLMLFVLKGLTQKYQWKNQVIGFAFWSINIG